MKTKFIFLLVVMLLFASGLMAYRTSNGWERALNRMLGAVNHDDDIYRNSEQLASKFIDSSGHVNWVIVDSLGVTTIYITNAIADSIYFEKLANDNASIDSLGYGSFNRITITDSAYIGDDLEVVDDVSIGGDLALTGSITLSGAQTFNVSTVEDSAYTVLLTDYLINVSYTDTDTVDVTIPTIQAVEGRYFEIWDTEFNAAINAIIIYTEGAELVNEAAADTISTNGGKRRIWSDGTNWFSRE